MAEESLRDTIAAAVEAAPEIAAPEASPAPAEPVAAPEASQTASSSTESRVRDESGRFTKKADDSASPSAPAQTNVAEVPPPPASAAPTPAQATPRKAPQSWKKDYWDAFGQLDPKVQDYIEQREREAASGVSQYRQQAESARELQEAIAPFAGELQAGGTTAGQWISSVAQTHLGLVRGTPQEKLAILQRLGASYGVPARLAVQDAQGQWQLVGDLPAPQSQQPQGVSAADIPALVSRAMEEQQMNAEVQKMIADSDTFPHLGELNASMQGLLRAGLANDIPSAYQAALALPQHADLARQASEKQAADATAKAAADRAAAVNRARANTTSVRSATPSGAMVSAGKADLRSQLSANYDATMGGRV